MNGNKAQVGNLLYRLGAIQFGAFRLKLHEKQPDAPLSPIYLNLRTASHPTKPGPLTPEAMQSIGDLLFQELGDFEFDHFVGLPDAGEPFADELEKVLAAHRSPATRLRLRKEDLPDGQRHIAAGVEGDFQPLASVLLIDDLITQADSKLEAIEALENEHLLVEYILVLVDRQQGGREQLENEEYKLLSVFTLEGLLSLYVDEWFITGDQANEVRNYLRANSVA